MDASVHHKNVYTINIMSATMCIVFSSILITGCVIGIGYCICMVYKARKRQKQNEIATELNMPLF